jgi:hypothetical protein
MGNAMNDLFESFWELYPRKVKKGAARTAFNKAIKIVDFPTIVAGVERYRKEVSGREFRFILHAATWLNGECWEDEAGANDDKKVFAVATPQMSVDDVWRARLKHYKPGGFWSPTWGSKPEHGGSDIPRHILTDWQHRTGANAA